MSIDELEALALRCEKATGPDRGLDLEIAAALTNYPNARVMDVDGFQLAVAGGDSDLTFDIMLQTPPYTGSIDASMALVPGGAKVLEFEQDSAHEWAWWCWISGPAGQGTSLTFDAARSLCAAALKARVVTPTVSPRSDL